MQNIIFAVLGVVFTVAASFQVMPSVTKYIQAKKAENLIEKEKAVFLSSPLSRPHSPEWGWIQPFLNTYRK